ncbi:MAG: hypothetical protein QY302_02020 [Anaerolineales bacterium]|nr:MAG: hypothetical protein QY302_02020 [Anaerolineales bacterium]
MELGKNDDQNPAPSLPTSTQTPSITNLTTTPTSNLENSVLIAYEYDANDSIDHFTACLTGLDTFSFILYENGHVILFEESIFVETIIPQAEIEKLLAAIESTGFFLVKGGGDEFVSIPPTPSFAGSSMQTIKVKEKTFAITAEEYQYLVESIKETIQIIKDYKPPGLTPYVPDKLYIWVYPIQDTSLENYDPTPTPPTLDWPYESIPLDTLVFTPNSPSRIISNEHLRFLIQELNTVPAYRMVRQNGQYYLLMTCPAF